MQKKQRYWLIIVVLVAVAMIAGCDNEKGNHLHIGVAEEKDMQKMAADFSRADELTVLAHLYRGLFEVDNQKQVVPFLVDDYSYQDDNKKLTISLRDDLHWSDGQLLSADDVLHSLSALENGTSKYAYQFRYIDWDTENPIMLNEQGDIEIYLAEANPNFHKLLAMPIFFPVKNIEDPLAGPFSGSFLVSEQKNNRLVMIPDQSRDQASDIVTESIIINYDLGRDELAEKYKNRSFDVVFSEEDLLAEDYQTIKAPAIRLLWINSQNEPWNDINNRRALATLVDRKSLLKVLPGEESAIQGIYPSEYRTQEILPVYPAADAGSLANQTMQLISLDSQENQVLAETIKGQIEKSSDLLVTIELLDEQGFLIKIKQGDFDLALDQWEADVYGKEPFFELFKSPLISPLNASRLIVPEINALQKELELNPDPERREQIYIELEQLIIDYTPAVFLSEGMEKKVYSKRVKNIEYDSIYRYQRYHNVVY